MCPFRIQRFSLNPELRFSFFFFLSHLTCVSGATSTVAALFITVHVLKNIKNRSHETIHTFKNYFAIILSIFSFSNNKFNPNLVILP